MPTVADLIQQLINTVSSFRIVAFNTGGHLGRFDSIGLLDFYNFHILTFAVAATALLVYEVIITLPEEINYVWM